MHNWNIDYHHRGSKIIWILKYKNCLLNLFKKTADVIGGMVLGVVVALFITLLVGRVLWEYDSEASYSDFDLKPS